MRGFQVRFADLELHDVILGTFLNDNIEDVRQYP
jgi:hypothetical protein